MQQINAEIKPTLSDMRYYTYGDYYIKDDETLKFDIVDHGNKYFNMLTLLHELAEYIEIELRGISVDSIDKYDKEFENDSERVKLYFEPGADPTCIYKESHDLANSFVKKICDRNGLDYNAWLMVDLDGKLKN